MAKRRTGNYLLNNRVTRLSVGPMHRSALDGQVVSFLVHIINALQFIFTTKKKNQRIIIFSE